MDIERVRQQNREKVRRWRQRNAVRLLVEREQQATGIPHGRKPMHRVVEVVDDGGYPLRVFVARVDEAIVLGPGEALSSRWVPSRAVSLKMARMLVAQRLATIRAWSGLGPTGGL